MISINIKVEGLDKAMAAINPKIVKASAYRTINRSVDGLVTDVSKEVRTTFNIKKQDIDPRIKKQRCPDYNTLRGEVSITDEPKSKIPLIMFGAVERRNLATGSVKTKKGKDGFYSQKLKRKGQQGVSYKVLKQGGKGFSGNAFIIPGGRGSLQVVRRLPGQKGRFDLAEKRVISIAAMAGSLKHGVMARIKQAAEQRMATNFDRELKYYQARAASGQGTGWSGRGQ
jgi:hypothetical protein